MVVAAPPGPSLDPIPSDTYRLAARTWAAAGLLTVSEDETTVTLHPTTQAPEEHHADHHVAPLTAEPETWDSSRPPRLIDTPVTSTPVAIYDPFGGTGFLRMAVNELLGRLGARHSLVASGFSEIQPAYGQAVQQYWASTTCPEWGPPHEWLTRDVWDMLDEDDEGLTPLARFLAKVPRGALFLVGGGFPCRQTSQLSRLGGRLGLHGPDSVLFLAMPILRHRIRQARPDLVVQMLVENVDTMLDHFRDAICVAMGDLPAPHVVRHTNEAYCRFPRRRLWFGTFRLPQRPSDTIAPPGRHSPWEPGWAPHWEGRSLTMLTSRRPDCIWPSPYQCRFHCLVYQRTPDFAIPPWHDLPLGQVYQRLQSLFAGNGELRASCRAVHELNPEDMGDLGDPYVSWLLTRGPQLGVRPPTVDERARATGYGRYLLALREFGLTDLDLWNLTGNHFDCTSVQLMLAPLLRNWVYLQPVPATACPAPATLARILAGLVPVIQASLGPIPFTPQPAPWPPRHNWLATHTEDLPAWNPPRFQAAPAATPAPLAHHDAPSAAPAPFGQDSGPAAPCAPPPAGAPVPEDGRPPRPPP